MTIEKISSENLNKELAYLFGVYLTDGCISDNRFCLQVIDKEFAEFTLSCIKKIKPNCMANVYERDATKKGNWNKSIQYCIHPGFTEYKTLFENQTNKKHHIPYCIWDASLDLKKWFIAGVMDGDGYISISKRFKEDKNPQFNIGIGGVEDGWIYEFKELLEKIGVRINKPERFLTKWNIPFVRFRFDKENFISRGLFFTIGRKQKRLKEIIEKRSETIGCESDRIKI